MSRTSIEFDMPTTCTQCPLRWYDVETNDCYCRAFDYELDEKYRLSFGDIALSRPKWCPLKETF